MTFSKQTKNAFYKWVIPPVGTNIDHEFAPEIKYRPLAFRVTTCNDFQGRTVSNEKFGALVVFFAFYGSLTVRP